MDEVNTISLLDDDNNVIGFNNASGIEEGEVTFILPADNYFSSSFELDTNCGVIENVSSNTFSKPIGTQWLWRCAVTVLAKFYIPKEPRVYRVFGN